MFHWKYSDHELYIAEYIFERRMVMKNIAYSWWNHSADFKILHYCRKSPDFTHYPIIWYQILILDHTLLYESCSTHQDLSNELYFFALLQNIFFYISGLKARPGRNFDPIWQKVPGVKKLWKKITILLGSGVNSCEKS